MPDRGVRGTLADEAANGVVHLQHLEDAGASDVAGLTAMRAAAAARELHRALAEVASAEPVERGGADLVRLAALGTELANQPHAHHRHQRSGDHEGLEPEVD